MAMTGSVDATGRALMLIALRASMQAAATKLEVWIDTGFTGELVIPQAIISMLNLPQSGTATAQLGDGSTVIMNTYTCIVDWFGQEKKIEVVSNSGRFPFLEIGLLRDHKLTVDYVSQSVTVI